MRQQRRGMDPAWIAAASERIQRTVLASAPFQTAQSIACYLALPYEVQTGQILKSCWETGKAVSVPAYNEDKGRYELTWMRKQDPTQRGLWNIREPESKDRVGLMDLDLLIVPALAYDRTGGRLGHGGGHYDRVLGSWSGLKIGVAFDFQVFDRIPMGSQDMPVDLIVTEVTTYLGHDGN